MGILHYDVVRADVVGTTADTPETIGTIQLLPETSDVHLLFIQDVSTATRTSAEATSGTFNFNFRSLLNDILVVPSAFGEGGTGATNINGAWCNGKFIPLRVNKKADLGNARITGTYEVNLPEPTSDMAAQFMLAYSVGGIDKNFLANRGLAQSGALKTAISWCDREEDDNVGPTVTAFAHTNAITVPHWVSRVTAVGNMANNDAIASANEHFLADVEFTGTMQGLDPMHTPVPAAWAVAGTPAASEIQFGELISPMYIEAPQTDVTMQPNTNLQASTSAGVQIVTSLYGF